MKKIHPFAVFALATAVTALGSGTVLAQHGTGQDMETDAQTQSAQHDEDDMYSTPKTNPSTTKPTSSTTKPTSSTAYPTSSTKPIPNANSSQRAKDVVSQTPAADRANKPDHAGMHHGYMDSAPVNGMQATDLIGTEVKTTDGEDVVGSVNDLIIDENGQVVAVVIGVDGYQGMGEKDVAIGWDDVTRSGTADDHELRITVSRDTLRPAPEFAKQD